MGAAARLAVKRKKAALALSEGHVEVPKEAWLSLNHRCGRPTAFKLGRKLISEMFVRYGVTENTT